MRALILAGGFGTRLRESVPDLPKPMAPIAGRPFLEYLLDRVIGAGITDITLSTGYMADVFSNHFGGTYKSARITHVAEQKPLGTGGAIVHALGNTSKDPWLVMNGDTLLDLDYHAFLSWYRDAPSDFAMVLRKVPDVSRYGAVELHGDRITGFFEKGTGQDAGSEGLINSGIYILRPALFGQLAVDGRFSLETDVLQAHCAKLAPRGFVSSAYFIDIGVPEEYQRAQKELPELA